MKPAPWKPRVELSPRESRVLKIVKQRTLWGFLRKRRHELFDDAFQAEMAEMYTDIPGNAPTSPALLSMVTLLQAYTGLSDHDAVVAAQTDMKWRLVLGLLDSPELEDAPFSQGALPGFRRRMMLHNLDRRLLERTVELAKTTGDFGYKPLRLALDSSPLFTASRVEDTFNLLGHAARKVLVAAATMLGEAADDLVALADEAGIPLLAGDPEKAGGSLKARLDVAWEKPEERARALSRLVRELEALQVWLSERSLLTAEPVASAWAVVESILGQDVEPDPDTGAPQVKQGVAPGRRPSVEDGEARHGRKSRSQKFIGYKRHLAVDLGSKLILAVGVAPANKPEAAITQEVSADLAYVLAGEPDTPVAERIASLSVDRAYLASDLAREVRQAGGLLLCRALSAGSLGSRFTKAAFTMTFPGPVGMVTCPAGVTIAATPGSTAHFPASKCAACPRRAACTNSRSGRSVSIHPDEAFHQELRARQATPEGRAALRERTRVEHVISRQVSVQGRRARFKTTRKNLMATRIGASVVNLHTLDHAQRERDAV